MLATLMHLAQAVPTAPGTTPILIDGATDPAAPSAIVTPEVVWSSLAPMLILLAGAAIGLLVVSLIRAALPQRAITLWTVAVAAASVISTVPLWGRVGNPSQGPASLVAGALGIDRFSLLCTALIGIAVILASLLADDYLRREGLQGPEMQLLMLIAAAGGGVMVAANDLIVLFIGIEILSITSYVLVAMHRRRISSQEAGLKYFVLGAFSSAFLLYGIALIYGATGGTNLLHVQTFLSNNLLTDDFLMLAGLAMLVVGFGFKVAAAPLHMWTPDAYQGAPSPVTAFMSTAVKVAAFGAMIRVFVVGFAAYVEQWRPMILMLCVASLIVGSVTAVVQTNVKRMLAYSSIAHGGFLLLGVEAASERGTSSTLFYLAAYTAMSAGSFGIVTLVGRTGDGRHGLDDYRGLSRQRPVLALAFTVLLLAQAGTPFTAGFLAKLGVITAVAERGHWWLAAIAMLSAVISAFLYLRIIVAMYFDGLGEAAEPTESEPIPIPMPWTAMLSIGAAVVLTLVMGFIPDYFTDLTAEATPQLVEVGGQTPTASPLTPGP